MIDIKNLSFSYPHDQRKIVSNISLSIAENEVVGIVGASGCGKSTLLLCMSGLIPHSIAGILEGDIFIHGKSVRDTKLPELSQIVQLLFQSPESQLFALTVEDDITFGLENLNLPWREIEMRRDEALQKMGIVSLRHNSVEELSSGQKQRVALASLLAMNPSVLLLDEPTANIDDDAAKHLVSCINALAKKHIVVIVEHNIAFVEETCKRH